VKIAVIAANGRSGQTFVKAALDAGHQVIAGVYRQNDFIDSRNLVVKKCDATNKLDVANLVSGCDAVVCLIGHGRRSPPRVQSEAISNIISVMNQKKIKRLISLTGTGVRFDNDRPNLIDKILNFSIKLIDSERIKDGIEHAEILKKSNLDWTLIRVLKLTNGSHKGTVLFSRVGPAETFTPRSRVASAILDVAEDSKFIKEAPIIIGAGK
jgi:putative NADH-flavin reductase